MLQDVPLPKLKKVYTDPRNGQVIDDSR
jgi:hypothetical protein